MPGNFKNLVSGHARFNKAPRFAPELRILRDEAPQQRFGRRNDVSWMNQFAHLLLLDHVQEVQVRLECQSNRNGVPSGRLRFRAEVRRVQNFL